MFVLYCNSNEVFCMLLVKMHNSQFGYILSVIQINGIYYTVFDASQNA